MSVNNLPISKKHGFSLVEILVAASIMLIVAGAITSAFSKYILIARRNTNSVKAIYLLDEGVEIVKIMRDMSWKQNIEPIQNDSPFRVDRKTYSTTDSAELIGGIFDRTFVFSEICRNGNGDISECPSETVATDTRKITVNVTWNDGNGTNTKTLSTNISNLFRN
ncbi:MAG: type II secretion system protein [bacterium]